MSSQVNSRGLKVIRYETGQTDNCTTGTFPSNTVPAAGTIPYWSQVVDDAAVNITVTEAAGRRTQLIPSATTYLLRSVQLGDYVYIQGFVREIIMVDTDKQFIEIDYPFPATVTAQLLKISRPAYREVQMEITGGSTAVIQGVTSANTIRPIVLKNVYGVGAIAYDATGSEITFTIGV